MLSAEEISTHPLDDELLRTVIDPDYFRAHGVPHRLFDRLRAERPVAYCDPKVIEPFWILSRQEEIRSVLRQDPKLFSNTRRISLNLEGDTVFAHPSLLNMDPPEHVEHRSIVNPRFQPRCVHDRDGDFLSRTACRLLDQHMGDREGEADFVPIAEALSISAIARILGLAEENWIDGYRFANGVANSNDPEQGALADTPEESFRIATEGLFGLFAPLVAERTERPADDLVSVLVQARVGGRALELIDVLTHAGLLFLGGVETTRNVMAWGVYELAQRPAQWRMLQNDASLLRSATEEMIRWATPINHFTRTATADTTIGTEKIAAGQTVALFFCSANRDEAVFEAPHDFRIDRRPNRHLGFGLFEHQCIGNSLAREQLLAMFAGIRERFAELEVVRPPRRARNGNLNGFTDLPVRYRRKPGCPR